MTIDTRQNGNGDPGEYHPGRPEGYSTEGGLRLEEPGAAVGLGTVHEPPRDTPVYAETDVLLAEPDPHTTRLQQIVKLLGGPQPVVPRVA